MQNRPDTPPDEAAPVPAGFEKDYGIFTASTLMFCAVGLGAFGAHGLRDFLQQHGYAAVWETAVLYQLIHALALFAAGLFARARPQVRRARSFVFAGRLLLAGTLLFSGSLYALCLGAPKWIGPVTPLGGLSLMAGWIGYGIWSLRAGISTKREA